MLGFGRTGSSQQVMALADFGFPVYENDFQYQQTSLTINILPTVSEQKQFFDKIIVGNFILVHQ
jgi:hypothetical protein